MDHLFFNNSSKNNEHYKHQRNNDNQFMSTKIVLHFFNASSTNSTQMMPHSLVSHLASCHFSEQLTQEIVCLTK
jgi:hypothetical protein